MPDFCKGRLNGTFVRYGLTVAVVAATFLLRWILVDRLGLVLPEFILCYPGIMLVAVVAGLGPGLLATASFTVGTDYLFLPPFKNFRFATFPDGVALVLFLTMGVLMCLSAEFYRRSKWRVTALGEHVLEGRAKLEVTLGSMADAVLTFDARDRILDFNDAFVRFHRYRSRAECPVNLSDFASQFEVFLLDGTVVPVEDWTVSRALRGETATNSEYRLRRRDTGETWVGSYSFNPLRDSEGAITGAVVVARDVTEARRMEDALRESERQFHTLADAIPQLCWIANKDGSIYWYNQRWYDYTGTSPKDMEGLGWQSVYDPATLPAVLQNRQVSIATGEPFDMVFPLRGADGVFRPFLTGINPVKDADGTVLRWFGTNTDISEQQKAQENIENLNRVLGVLSDINQMIVREKDPQAMMNAACSIAVDKGKFRMAWIGMADPTTHMLKPVAWSGMVEGYLERFWIDLEDPVRAGGPGGRCFHSGDHVVCNDIEHDSGYELWRRAALERGYKSSAAFPLRCNGSPVGVFCLYASEPAFFDTDQITMLDELAMDISFALEVNRSEEEHRRAEEELRWRTAFFEAQVESSSDGVLVVDNEGRKILQNQRLNELFKIPQQVSENPDDAQQRAFVATVVKDAAQFAEKVNYLMAHPEDVSRDEVELVDGTIVERYSSPVRDKANHYYGRIWTFRDITEQRQLEEQYRQSQKMEAVGQLTGGIAHDFNNLLTVVQGCAEFIGEGVRDNPRLSKMAEMILGAAKRGADLTHRMLAFARRQSLQSRAVNVNQLLLDLESFLQRTLGAEIAMELIQGSGDFEAFVDPNQLESAILNLCVNARDAMPGGGKLTIETHWTELDADYAKQNAEVIPGQYVLVAVSDTGSGISPENLLRVFDPFFTTKDVGKGTGLGLSMVYGFAKQSKGHVKIYSEPGRGTSVKLYLPMADKKDEEQNDIPLFIGDLRGSEIVLLVEDNGEVREFAKSQLAYLGYDVFEAANGEDALKIVGERPDIDLLFTDMIMPGGMNGRELAVQACGLRPALKVLYCSGYAENAAGHQAVLDLGAEFLSKPYTRLELARRIRRVMSGNRS
ncbi:MAG TPA: PAS domain-containing protein [Terracidiphilus sp.]|nr:PAS domain-containing protein [Terracidiphilus sp.]